MFHAVCVTLFLTIVLGVPFVISFFLGACVYVNKQNKKKCKKFCNHLNNCHKH